MGKKKVFPTVDLSVPIVEHTHDLAGRVVVPLDVMPPTDTVVHFPLEGNASQYRRFDFMRWYGAGIDEITYACQRQIERFIATHDGDLAPATVVMYCLTLGTFAVILAMRRDGALVENISDLSGLSRTHPTMAFFLAMLLFSLAGIPPLAGFFAKFYVFLAAIKAGLYVLAVIGVLASVVGAYYYLTIIKIMYFDEPAKSFQSVPGSLSLVLGIAGLINILFFVYPAPIVSAATAAAKSLF